MARDKTAELERWRRYLALGEREAAQWKARRDHLLDVVIELEERGGSTELKIDELEAEIDEAPTKQARQRIQQQLNEFRKHLRQLTVELARARRDWERAEAKWSKADALADAAKNNLEYLEHGTIYGMKMNPTQRKKPSARRKPGKQRKNASARPAKRRNLPTTYPGVHYEVRRGDELLKTFADRSEAVGWAGQYADRHQTPVVVLGQRRSAKVGKSSMVYRSRIQPLRKLGRNPQRGQTRRKNGLFGSAARLAGKAARKAIEKAQAGIPIYKVTAKPRLTDYREEFQVGLGGEKKALKLAQKDLRKKGFDPRSFSYTISRANPQRKKAAQQKKAATAKRRNKTTINIRAKRVVVRSRRNPDAELMTAARQAYHEFHGREPHKVVDMFAPTGSGAPQVVTILGPLHKIYLQGKTPLDFGGRPDSPQLAEHPVSKNQLYVLGRNYKLSPAQGGVITRIEYVAKKDHLGDKVKTIYYHKAGEETGERPRLVINKDGHALIAGGAYWIDSAGIHN